MYRAGAGALTAALLLLVACLDDSPVASGRPTIRAMLNANVIGAMAGGTVRIRVGYRTSAQQLVPLPATPEQIEVAPGTTVVVPLTVDIGPCLSDSQRAPEGEPGCRLIIELTLSDAGGTVIDSQTREAEGAPATPGQAVNFGTVTIGVPPPPLIISQLPAPGCVIVGQTVTLAVESPPAAVAWTVASSAIATIDAATGVVTGRAAGTTTATATSTNRTGTATICVVGPLEVTPSSVSILAARTAQITASASGGNVSFSSNATSIATVEASGLVHGVGIGQATITTTLTAASGTQTATTLVTVNAGGIAITPTSASAPLGRSVRFTAVAQDADGKPLTGTSATWSVTDASVASLSATTGVSVDVRAVVVGVTTVRASAGGATASASFAATEPLPAAQLEKVSGDGAACATYSSGCTFVVRALDVEGFPVAGAHIEWFSESGCPSGANTVTDDEGLSSTTNFCSATPGKYTQTALLLTNQQEVTFTYTLQGLTLTILGTDTSGKTSIGVRNSTGTASGLAASVKYVSGPVANYVTGLGVSPSTTPATVTFSIDYSKLPVGGYVFDVIVTTTTPGIGPGIATFEFFNDSGADAQPLIRRISIRPTADASPAAAGPLGMAGSESRP